MQTTGADSQPTTPSVSPDRRHSPDSIPGSEGSAVEYSARRGEYRYLQLLQLWGSCSECGGHRLMRPARTQRVRIPEAAGICSDCESAFMLIEGNVRLIRPRA